MIHQIIRMTTESPIKVNSFLTVMKAKPLTYKIETDCEQPASDPKDILALLGITYTLWNARQMAIQRIQKLVDQNPSSDETVDISIENGIEFLEIFKIPDGLEVSEFLLKVNERMFLVVDRATLVVCTPDKKFIEEGEYGCLFPIKSVIDAAEIGFATTTVGSIIPNVNPKDPHLAMPKYCFEHNTIHPSMSRLKYLEELLISFKQKNPGIFD